jgi:ribulose bisphosphate carboxylase small subunit
MLSHVRGLFVESPGLRLTSWQIQRLWGLDVDQARQVIDQLVEMQFLRAARDGTYVRRES